ncbi:MAG: ParA family protein [Selenomonadaceae bacterium]|nr:ParA family protein [Selenomonadaceae bacterium]
MDNTLTIIALANQKGGVAKTTCTYNLAAVKAKQGHRVLMIDLDPQASLTISCGIEPGAEEFQYNTCDLFNWKVNPAECCYSVDKSGLDNLFIVPSDIDLALTERKLVSGRNSDVQLRKATQALRKYFDYIFIDCPPQLGTLLTNALTAADEVVVPVKTDYLAYRGLKALIETIEGVKSGDGDRSLNPELKFAGVIATMYQVSSNDHRDILEMLNRHQTVLGVIRNTVEVNRKIIDGVPVVLSNPTSDSAVSYKAIAERL